MPYIILSIFVLFVDLLHKNYKFLLGEIKLISNDINFAEAINRLQEYNMKEKILNYDCVFIRVLMNSITLSLPAIGHPLWISKKRTGCLKNGVCSRENIL